MAKKAKSFEDRVKEYLKKRAELLASLEISEDTIIGMPGGQKPGVLVRFALWLLRGAGARMQFNFQDLTKK